VFQLTPFTPTPKAARRVEFFTTQINNDNTRKAYLNATRRFADGAINAVLVSLPTFSLSISPLSSRTFKGIFAAHGETTPGRAPHAVRLAGHRAYSRCEPGPRRARPEICRQKGQDSVLTTEEARLLLDGIVVRNTGAGDGTELGEPVLIGLRDRAPIGVMVYTFARVNAVLQMKVKDYFVQGPRGGVRLHEKGGKEHEVPCHHNLETVPR